MGVVQLVEGFRAVREELEEQNRLLEERNRIVAEGEEAAGRPARQVTPFGDPNLIPGAVQQAQATRDERFFAQLERSLVGALRTTANSGFDGITAGRSGGVPIISNPQARTQWWDGRPEVRLGRWVYGRLDLIGSSAARSSSR